jgi:hypothetical protein
MEMVTEARERVARALEVTQEHRLESQLSGIPIESKLQK